MWNPGLYYMLDILTQAVASDLILYSKELLSPWKKNDATVT